MRYYKLGQTTGHVCRVLDSDGTNHWVGQIDETDHLWMCDISNVQPLLLWCNDLKVGHLGGGRGRCWLRAVEGNSCHLLALTKGCSLLLLYKIVVYFRISQHPFSLYGCFLKSDFERMNFRCLFSFVIGTKELDHVSKGNQFCLVVECPFLTSLLWSITSFCPFCHYFPSFVLIFPLFTLVLVWI